MEILECQGYLHEIKSATIQTYRLKLVERFNFDVD